MYFTVGRRAILAGAAAFFLSVLICIGVFGGSALPADGDFIKWVDFNASYAALDDALNADIQSGGKYDWIEILAYLSAKNGNDFSSYKKSEISELCARIDNGEVMEEIAGGLKYYRHYLEIYKAVLGEYVGEYAVRVENPVDEDEPLW